MDKYYDDFLCDNKELLEELKQKEELFQKIAARLCKCPRCKKGHFYLESDDREYCCDTWWLCDNINCDHQASESRSKLLYEIVQYGDDEYWDFEHYSYIRDYKNLCEENKIEFSKQGFEDWFKKFLDEKKSSIERFWLPNDFEKINNYQEFIEDTIRGHIRTLDSAIESARSVKMLKPIFEKEGKHND